MARNDVAFSLPSTCILLLGSKVNIGVRVVVRSETPTLVCFFPRLRLIIQVMEWTQFSVRQKPCLLCPNGVVTVRLSLPGGNMRILMLRNRPRSEMHKNRNIIRKSSKIVNTFLQPKAAHQDY